MSKSFCYERSNNAANGIITTTSKRQQMILLWWKIWMSTSQIRIYIKN